MHSFLFYMSNYWNLFRQSSYLLARKFHFILLKCLQIPSQYDQMLAFILTNKQNELLIALQVLQTIICVRAHLSKGVSPGFQYCAVLSEVNEPFPVSKPMLNRSDSFLQEQYHVIEVDPLYVLGIDGQVDESLVNYQGSFGKFLSYLFLVREVGQLLCFKGGHLPLYWLFVVQRQRCGNDLEKLLKVAVYAVFVLLDDLLYSALKRVNYQEKLLLIIVGSFFR